MQKSNSGEFKRKAMTLLQVQCPFLRVDIIVCFFVFTLILCVQINSAEEVKEDVYGKLWQTAREKYNMLPPSLTANHLPSVIPFV